MSIKPLCPKKKDLWLFALAATGMQIVCGRTRYYTVSWPSVVLLATHAKCKEHGLTLYTPEIADRVKNFAVLYVCDLDQVPDFKQMYELYDPVTLMFFFRNKHMVSISILYWSCE